MQLTLKAKFPFTVSSHSLTIGKKYTSSFHNKDSEGVTNFLIEISDTQETFPDFVFDILCPFCDGNGQEVINLNLTDYEGDELIEVENEPIKIDCSFCEGRKTVSLEEINLLGEKKSQWCSCHHVKAHETAFIKNSWVHINCGKKIQDMD